MKLVVGLVVCLFIAVLATIDRTELDQRIKTAMDKCINDPTIGINKDELKAYRDSDRKGPKPANMGKMSMCVLKDVRWIKEDNSMDTTELKELVDRSDNITENKRRMDECTADRGTPEERANRMMECLMEFGRVQKTRDARTA